jgi:zinc transport system permease protein
MLEMFEYDFMQRAFIAGIVIAVLASVSGTFIVLRRYSDATIVLSVLSTFIISLVVNKK